MRIGQGGRSKTCLRPLPSLCRECVRRHPSQEKHLKGNANAFGAMVNWDWKGTSALGKKRCPPVDQACGKAAQPREMGERKEDTGAKSREERGKEIRVVCGERRIGCRVVRATKMEGEGRKVQKRELVIGEKSRWGVNDVKHAVVEKRWSTGWGQVEWPGIGKGEPWGVRFKK